MSVWLHGLKENWKWDRTRTGGKKEGKEKWKRKGKELIEVSFLLSLFFLLYVICYKTLNKS